MNPQVLAGRFIAVLTFAMIPCLARAAQFVEVAAQIETKIWSSSNPTALPKTRVHEGRCVVGTNAWMIEGDFMSNARLTFWFTGTTIVEHTLITKLSPEPATKPPMPRFSGRPLAVGSQFTKIYSDPEDGSISDPTVHLYWLAICSGQNLSREGRRLPIPRTAASSNGHRPGATCDDQTVVFKDALGLPKSVKLFAPKDNLIWEYRVEQTTNFLGWTFPSRFSAVSYRPAFPGEGLKPNYSYSGTIISIKAAEEPKIPQEVFEDANLGGFNRPSTSGTPVNF